jgi:hypothetical protein
MRLTLSIAGFNLDVTLGRETQDPIEDDAPGSYTSYPVGFVRDPDVPWEDRGSLHQFEPDDSALGMSPRS